MPSVDDTSLHCDIGFYLNAYQLLYLFARPLVNHSLTGFRDCQVHEDTANDGQCRYGLGDRLHVHLVDGHAGIALSDNHR